MNDDLQYDSTGIDLTKASEGCRLTAYQDSVGVWTIGIGHTGPDVYDGMTITEDDAAIILLRDISSAEEAVKRLVTVPLTQGQFDALVDFTFNLGQGNLASSTLLRKLNAGDALGASLEFDRWNKAGGKVLAGLTIRRDSEEKVFQS